LTLPIAFWALDKTELASGLMSEQPVSARLKPIASANLFMEASLLVRSLTVAVQNRAREQADLHIGAQTGMECYRPRDFMMWPRCRHHQADRYSFPRNRLEPGQYSIRVRAAGYELDGAWRAEVWC